MRLLRVIEKATGEVVEEMDISNETEGGATQIRNGLRQQMNHVDFRLEELETPVMIAVTYLIDNFYEDGEKIKTTVETHIPAPPDDGDPDQALAYEEWEDEHVFNHTGANYPEGGDAGYFVTVASSSRPDLIPVGTTYEFC